MASLKGKTTRQNLLQKGFQEAPGDHHFFEFWHDGKMITRTKTSRNSEDIYDDLITAMSRQCKMTAGFFKEFALCRKTKEDYIEVLTNAGHIKKKLGN